MYPTVRHIDMNFAEYDLCKTQGELFEYVANMGVDMEWFVPAYLSSGFCQRSMDTTYSRYQTREPQEHLDFIVPEIGPLKMMDNLYFDTEVAYWMGYTYRQLYIETGVSSKDLVEKITIDTMCAYYPGLHTIDEEMATDIICENFKLEKIFREEELIPMEEVDAYFLAEYDDEE